MKCRIHPKKAPGSRGLQAGFTMVEIAICLGIIAFALVAIIGILPTGMKVQKENRTETIINQEGSYWIEAIRSGSKGLDELTNYVEFIDLNYGTASRTFTNRTGGGSGALFLTNGQHIVGLLSVPRLEVNGNGNIWRSNSVFARVKAITGGALEKSKTLDETAFRYQLETEVVPFTNRPRVWAPGSPMDLVQTTNLLHNLYDVRLTLRWPLFQNGNQWRVGRNKRTFRTLVAGELERYNAGNWPYSLYFFKPNVTTSTNTVLF